jgi:arylsulfatase A-like enzyme
MNVLVYVVDCLRSDHLSCYGYGRETTPNIDAVAAEGVRYERCFTPATWTRPASVSLLTGTYPPAHGVRHREDRFPSEITRLPGVLSEAGFETVGVSTMGNVSTALGYDEGFDEYHDLYKEDALVEKRRRGSTEREKLFHEDREEIALPRAEDITDRLDAVYERSTEDLFAFCWGIDLHMPLYCANDETDFLNPEYDGPFDGSFESFPDDPTDADLDRLRDLYDTRLRYTDDQFGAVVDTLKRTGRYDDTLIVVLGDHGEAFDEHGFLFHGNCPYDELLGVPLIVKPPADHNARGVVSELASLIDVFPTVLNILGIDGRADHVQGRALPPFGDATGGDPVFSETQLQAIKPAYHSVRTDRWKYIEITRPSLPHVIEWLYAHREDVPDLRFALATVRDGLSADLFETCDRMLYDLTADPGERRNLVDQRPDVTSRLGRRLDDWRIDCADLNDRLTESSVADIDAGTAEQLKQLGYVE